MTAVLAVWALLATVGTAWYWGGQRHTRRQVNRLRVRMAQRAALATHTRQRLNRVTAELDELRRIYGLDAVDAAYASAVREVVVPETLADVDHMAHQLVEQVEAYLGRQL